MFSCLVINIVSSSLELNLFAIYPSSEVSCWFYRSNFNTCGVLALWLLFDRTCRESLMLAHAIWLTAASCGCSLLARILFVRSDDIIIDRVDNFT